jgi:hypothetical protein
VGEECGLVAAGARADFEDDARGVDAFLAVEEVLLDVLQKIALDVALDLDFGLRECPEALVVNLGLEEFLGLDAGCACGPPAAVRTDDLHQLAPLAHKQGHLGGLAGHFRQRHERFDFVDAFIELSEASRKRLRRLGLVFGHERLLKKNGRKSAPRAPFAPIISAALIRVCLLDAPHHALLYRPAGFSQGGTAIRFEPAATGRP